MTALPGQPAESALARTCCDQETPRPIRRPGSSSEPVAGDVEVGQDLGRIAPFADEVDDGAPPIDALQEIRRCVRIDIVDEMEPGMLGWAREDSGQIGPKRLDPRPSAQPRPAVPRQDVVATSPPKIPAFAERRVGTAVRKIQVGQLAARAPPGKVLVGRRRPPLEAGEVPRPMPAGPTAPFIMRRKSNFTGGRPSFRHFQLASGGRFLKGAPPPRKTFISAMVCFAHYRKNWHIGRMLRPPKTRKCRRRTGIRSTTDAVDGPQTNSPVYLTPTPSKARLCRAAKSFSGGPGGRFFKKAPLEEPVHYLSLPLMLFPGRISSRRARRRSMSAWVIVKGGRNRRTLPIVQLIRNPRSMA